MKFDYDLVLGLPHTNYRGLAEHLLMMQAGHFQWAAIATAGGAPMSSFRTVSGREVYAAFYYIETKFPAGTTIDAFKLDDQLRFSVCLRASKNITLEGRVTFDRADRLSAASCPSDVEAQHPFIHFGNIFITPVAGNTALRVSPPANADFRQLPALPNEENPYQRIREAQTNGRLDVIGPDWECLDDDGEFAAGYEIDAERDTNGAGLVYFANYVIYMDVAERRAMSSNAGGRFSPANIAGRSLAWRRIAYYGNAALDDRIRTHVSLFAHPDDPHAIGVRSTIYREGDGRLICRAEAIKRLPQQ